MSEKSTSTSSGIGLFGGVFLIFLTLKLAEIGPVAAWSWLWVFSPLWIPLSIFLTAAIVFAVVVGIRKKGGVPKKTYSPFGPTKRSSPYQR